MTKKDLETRLWVLLTLATLAGLVLFMVGCPSVGSSESNDWTLMIIGFCLAAPGILLVLFLFALILARGVVWLLTGKDIFED